MSDRSNLHAHIAYDDLREWLDHAERLGEVRHVTGATWQETSGSPPSDSCAPRTAPAWCSTTSGLPKGFRLLLNVFAGTRRNMTFGFRITWANGS